MQIFLSLNFLSAHIINFFFSSDPLFHAMNFIEKNFDLDKMRFFSMFKNPKILFSCGRPVLLITALTCSELRRRFRNM